MKECKNIPRIIALAVVIAFGVESCLCLPADLSFEATPKISSEAAKEEATPQTYTKAAKAGAWPVPRKITYGHHVVYGAAPAQGEESALRPVRKTEQGELSIVSPELCSGG